jgi:hypothetical protein
VATGRLTCAETNQAKLLLSIDGSLAMDDSDDPHDLERKIEQASRIAKSVTDQTTSQRLISWVDELKQRLQRRFASGPSHEEIGHRAHELWVKHGRPIGRDKEFWLQAEAELKSRPEK